MKVRKPSAWPVCLSPILMAIRSVCRFRYNFLWMRGRTEANIALQVNEHALRAEESSQSIFMISSTSS